MGQDLNLKHVRFDQKSQTCVTLSYCKDGPFSKHSPVCRRTWHIYSSASYACNPETLLDVWDSTSMSQFTHMGSPEFNFWGVFVPLWAAFCDHSRRPSWSTGSGPAWQRRLPGILQQVRISCLLKKNWEWHWTPYLMEKMVLLYTMVHSCYSCTIESFELQCQWQSVLGDTQRTLWILRGKQNQKSNMEDFRKCSQVECWWWGTHLALSISYMQVEPTMESPGQKQAECSVCPGGNSVNHFLFKHFTHLLWS